MKHYCEEDKISLSDLFLYSLLPFFYFYYLSLYGWQKRNDILGFVFINQQTKTD